MSISPYNFSVYIYNVYINWMLLSRHMRNVSKIFIMWNAMRSTQLHMQYRRSTRKQRYSTISNFLLCIESSLSLSRIEESWPSRTSKTSGAKYLRWTRLMSCIPTGNILAAGRQPTTVSCLVLDDPYPVDRLLSFDRNLWFLSFLKSPFCCCVC